VCEEFHCLPSQAARELARTPVGFVQRILKARVFAQAKAMYDAAHEQGHEAAQRLPRTPIFDLVKTIDFEIANADRDAHA